MTSTENLNRILKSNKAKKVKQLSEIAALFEKEQRISNQIREVEQFQKSVESERETTEEFRKNLPHNFLEQEDTKRNQLLNNAVSFRIAAEVNASEIRKQKAQENEKLARLESVIDRIDSQVRRQKSIQDQIQEINESEEIQSNV